MEITITGDLVVDQPYDISRLDKEVVALFNQHDLNIVNLEAPLTNASKKIPKTGRHLKANKINTSQLLNALDIDIATLANNHILDYDEQGVKDTLDFCQKENIHHAGAGKNLAEASQTLFLDTKEGEIALVNFAENEWANATKKTAGANPMDIIDNSKQIKQANKNADFVLVIVHGGNEYIPYPSPRMAKQYRFYAECGADAVVSHHTHCISGYERHKGVPIFYSLGNFLFTTQNQKPDAWYSGLLLKLDVQSGEKINFEIIPVSQTRDSHHLSVLTGNDKMEVMQRINQINKIIEDGKLLEIKWTEFIEREKGHYIKAISPVGAIRNKSIRAAVYRLKLHNLFLPENYLKEFLNRIRCEAHLDATKQIFKQLIDDI